MPIETASFINDLTPSNPLSSDPAGQGDDHLRLIKSTLKGTLPNMGAVFSQVRSQDTNQSISSAWNTNHYIVSNSATTTVLFTLPPAASITSGFYIDFTTLAGANIVVSPTSASINGATSLAIPEQTFARAYFVGGTSWRCDKHPTGGTKNVFEGDVNIGGRLTVSGTAVLQNNLIVALNTGLLGALGVTGAAGFSDTVSISGATVLSTTLNVHGLTSISGATTLGSTLSVSAATVLGSTLSVAGATTIGGATTLKAGVSISGLTVTQGIVVGDVATFAAGMTISGTVNLTIGQLKFPSTQVPSSDANTLDDYEEGSWTPALTFGSPGDQVFAYSVQRGDYIKIGKMVSIQANVSTSTATHTTSAGSLFMTGLPFVNKSGMDTYGACNYSVMTVGATSGTAASRLSASGQQLDFIHCGIANNAQAALGVISHTSGNNFSLHASSVYQTNN